MRKTRHQNGRSRSILIAQNGSGLLQVTGRESQLINQRWREDMCIVHPQCVSLKGIMNTERRKIRYAAQKIERIIRCITIELILKKRLVRGSQPAIKAKSKCIRCGLELTDGAIILNRRVRHVRRRIKPGKVTPL